MEGDKHEMVTLVSKDEKEFHIKKDWAFISPGIKVLVEGLGATDEESGTKVTLQDIAGDVLSFICEYLSAKGQAKELKVPFDSLKFKVKFGANDSLAMDILVAANSLEI